MTISMKSLNFYIFKTGLDQFDEIPGKTFISAFQMLWHEIVGKNVFKIGLAIGLLLFYRLTRRIRKLNQSVDRFRGDERMSSVISTVPEVSPEDAGDEMERVGPLLTVALGLALRREGE